MTETRILVVEDERIVALDMERRLGNLGYTMVGHVSRGEEAIRQATETRPDVVLMDIHLKGDVDGIEAAERIRTQLDIPVVFVTAYADEETLQRAKITGPFGYIIKPFDERILHSTITMALYKHEVEQQLRDSERYFRALVEHASDIFGVLDQDTTIRYASPSVERMLGYRPEELMGKSVAEILHPDDVSQGRDGPRQASENETTRQSGEVRVRHKDGSWHTIEFTSQDRLADPVVGGIVINARDITERKQAELERERLLAQIQEQAQQIRRIVDTVPEGVTLLDGGGRLILANPLGEKYLITLADARMGDTLTHLADHPLSEFLTPPPNGLWHEVTIEEHVFQIVARPIETELGTDRWMLVIRDMTRQHEIERRARQQDRLAVVGQLAAGIAHDFNNIMATIILYAQMTARSKGLSADDLEYITTIDRQAQHATKLIKQILDFSRRSVLEQRPLDLAPLMEEQIALLRRTLPENIEIELICDRDEYVVNADSTHIQQAMMNLALNARDAMQEGGVLRIGLSQVELEPGERPPWPETGEETQNQAWVRVTVSDTGTGIPPDALPHIFEPFFTIKEPGKGSGLGLAQVHGIVGQHGGYIDVESQMGEGTRFTIHLPALPVHRPEPLLATESPPSNLGHGETILVVEDHRPTRRALTMALEQLNYRVLEAADGREALTVLEQHGARVALVLSDVVMPRMSGIVLAQAVRELGLDTPVVLLTGHSMMEEDLEDLKDQGVADWLLKPPSLKQLADVVAQALQST
jgi:two-component system cell cycle sensor histidine kinase/response regulator CckA